MICSDALIRFGDKARFLCRTCLNLVDGLADVLHGDELAIVARCENCGLVEHVFDVCARKAHRQTSKGLEVDVACKRFVARVNLENLFSALNVGDVDVDLSVKSARSHKSGIENIRAVGCRHDDD